MQHSSIFRKKIKYLHDKKKKKSSFESPVNKNGLGEIQLILRLAFQALSKL